MNHHEDEASATSSSCSYSIYKAFALVEKSKLLVRQLSSGLLTTTGTNGYSAVL